MSFEPEYTKTFLKKAKNLDPPLRKRLSHTISDILLNPRKGYLIVYHERKCHKYRMGNYRVIYQIKEEENIILFLFIDHRKRIYDR